MWLSLFLVLALAVIWSSIVSAAPDKIICYHGTWSVWRSGIGKFRIEDIDTNLCTHINYAYILINSDGTLRLNSDDPGFLTEFGKLKSRTPKPKLLIVFGESTEGTFSTVAANPSIRKNLLDNAIALIVKCGFDGLDFYWEYPGQRGGGSNDKKNFVTLLEEFRVEFNKRGWLLTAAVAATTSYYDVPGIAKSLDFINVMTYDFTGSRNTTTEHHASYYDTVNSINAWKSSGAPYNKLVLGISAYSSTVGSFPGESVSLSYSEICEKIMGGWSRKWSAQCLAPHAYGDNQWVCYDDPESIGIKANFAVENNLSGIMIWTVDGDDFRGTCGRRYPLLNAIKNGLQNPGSGTTPKPRTNPGIIIITNGNGNSSEQ